MVSFPRLTLLPGRAPLLWCPTSECLKIRSEVYRNRCLYMCMSITIYSSINNDFTFRYGHYSYGALVNHNLKGY